MAHPPPTRCAACRSPLDSLAAVASRQRGLATWDQILAAGYSEREVDGMVSRSEIGPAPMCEYRLAGTEVTWEQVLLSAVLSLGGKAVASHSSAARLWNFAYTPESAIEVTVGRSQRTTSRSIVLHRSRCFDESDVTHRSGIPCTSFERTLCDCTTLLSTFQLGRALDDGLRRGLVSLARLTDCAARLESGPRRRMSTVQQLLSQRDQAFVAGGSAAELRVVRGIAHASLRPAGTSPSSSVAGRQVAARLRVARARGVHRVLRPRVHSLPAPSPTTTNVSVC